MELIFGRGIRLASSIGFSPILATKNFLESTRFLRCTDPRRWKFRLSERHTHYRNLSCNYVPFFNRINAHEIPARYKLNKNVLVTRYCGSKAAKDATKENSMTESMTKLSMFAKMKQMTKDYWHVLVPVHVLTSIGWCVLFYITISNGVDVVQIMEFLNFSEKYLDMVKKSNAGNWALVYILYKIFTPIRYTVTLGCTTMAIKHLSKTGLVKPLPFGKKPQMTYKTTESSTATAKRKTESKVEQQTEPPKT